MTNDIINWIKNNRFKVLLLTIIAAVLVLFYVDNTIKINALLLQEQKQENMIKEQKTKNEILKSKIIELESAERITKIATEKLGMIKPTQILKIIEKDTTNKTKK